MFVTYDKLTNQDVTDTQMFKNGVSFILLLSWLNAPQM